jgi:hypothetical protein
MRPLRAARRGRILPWPSGAPAPSSGADARLHPVTTSDPSGPAGAPALHPVQGCDQRGAGGPRSCTVCKDPAGRVVIGSVDSQLRARGARRRPGRPAWRGSGVRPRRGPASRGERARVGAGEPDVRATRLAPSESTDRKRGRSAAISGRFDRSRGHSTGIPASSYVERANRPAGTSEPVVVRSVGPLEARRGGPAKRSAETRTPATSGPSRAHVDIVLGARLLSPHRWTAFTFTAPRPDRFRTSIRSTGVPG